jgi:hypothetical protein
MLNRPGASITDLAIACGFKSKNGKANRSKAQRILWGLTKRKLTMKDSKTGHHILTSEGKKRATDLS